jgi:hypothetical protein
VSAIALIVGSVATSYSTSLAEINIFTLAEVLRAWGTSEQEQD